MLGSSGLLGSGSLGRNGETLSLNVATGNFLISQRDEFLVGRGPDSAISRTYNSFADVADDNNDNWRQSTDRRVHDLVSGVSVKRTSADGSDITYTYNGSLYVATDGAGAYDTLSYSGGVWTWKDGDTQSTEKYEAYGAYWRITEASDTVGNKLTFSYSGANLYRVTTADGGYEQYNWTGSNITQVVTGYTDLVTSAAKTLTRARYDYDGSNRLIKVTVDLTPEDNAIADGAVYVTDYTYDGTSKRIASVAETDGSRVDISYDGSGRVAAIVQTVATGVTRTTTIGYTVNGDGSGSATVTDSLSKVTTVEWNADGSMKRVTSPPAYSGATAQVTQFNYTALGSGNVSSVVDPTGATTSYTYDPSGNVASVTDPLGNVVMRTYGAMNELLTETRTGSDSASSGANHTSRFVYDSYNRLVFSIDAMGRVAQYYYDSYSNLIRTERYSDSAFDLSGYGASTAITLATMISWDASVAGDRTNVENVVNTYDARGNLTGTTSYAIATSTGATSTADGTGQGSTVYDQAGQLLSRTLNGQNSESFEFDGLGRVKRSVDVNGSATAVTFGDAAMQTVVQLANGFTQTSVYDRAGELVSFAEAGDYVTGGTATYAYDQRGQVHVTTDATGHKSYSYYDAVGRKIADIDQYGGTTEYKYDADDRIVLTIRYGTVYLVPPSGGGGGHLGGGGGFGGGGTGTPPSPTPPDYAAVTDFATIRPTADATDLLTWQVYDADGRVIETIGGDGGVLTYQYDASDRLIGTTGYANKLSATTLAAIRTTPPTSAVLPTTDATHDSITRSFYDKAGLLIGTLDGEGFLQRFDFDKAGRKIAETTFATATATGLRASGTFDALVVSVGTAAADRTTRYVYDGQDHLRFGIDALGHVVEYVYDSGSSGQANGLVRQTIQYAGTISGLANYKIGTVKTAVTALASDANNRKTWAVYDPAGRLAYAIDATGAVQSMGYDALGRLIKTVRFAATRATTTLPDKATMDSWSATNIAAADNRVMRNYYAARGELRFAIDGEGFVTRYDYDAEGRVVGTVRWTTAITATDTTTIANVATLATGTNVTTLTTYDNDGRVATATDEEGWITTNIYNINGTLAQVWRPYAYTPPSSGGGGGAYVVPFAHVETSYTYNKAGRVLTRLENAFWVPDGNEQPLTSYAYDGLGNVVSVTDPMGVVMTRNYDRDGQLLAETRAAGSAEQAVTSYAYNGFGEVTAATDPNGSVSLSSYNQLGQLLSETDPLGGVTSYEYNAFDNAVKVTDERGNATYNYFDKDGRLIASRDAEDYVTETSYTNFGDIAAMTRRYNRASGAASVTTLPTYTADPANDATTLLEYDHRGSVKKSTDVMGFYEQYTLDFGGRRLTVRNKLGGIVTNAYDKRGLLVSETLPANSMRSDGTVEAASVTNHYEYDGRGNRTKMIEAFGLTEQRTTLYTYDKLDRLVLTAGDAVPDGFGAATAPAESNVYDLNGNVIEHVDATGAKTLYYYDKLNRVILQIDAVGDCTSYIYASVPGSGSTVTTRAYATPLSTLPAVEDRTPPALSGAYRETVSSFDKLGRLKTTSIAGIRTGAWVGGSYSTGLATLTTALDYDAAGNVIKTTDANGDIVYSYYDKLGRKTAQVDAGLGLTAWTLDSSGNVLSERRYATLATSAATGTPPSVATDANDRRTDFTYDLNGRRLTEARIGMVAYSVDPSSGALSGPSTVNATIYYAYNGLGQVMSKREATDATATVTYTYDLAGRLITEQRATFTDYQGNTATPTVDYAYDGLGNLTRSRQSGDVNTSIARVTTYAYGAGGRLLTMTDATGAARNYFYDLAGRKTGESYTRGTSTGSVTEGIGYSYDALGRSIGQAAYTVSGTSWTLAGDASQIAYNAFGEVKARGINGLQEQFDYDNAGHLWRSNSGDGVWRYFITDSNGNQTLAIESEGTDLSGKTIDQVLMIATVSNTVTVGSTYIDGINATATTFDKRNLATSSIQTMRQRSMLVGAANVTTSRTYNAFGEVLTETDARGTTSYSYNVMGRAVSIVRPSVTIVSVAGTSSSATPTDLYYYDVSGRLVGTRDANLNLMTRTLLAGTGYGGEAQVVKEFHPDTGVVTDRYDAYGDLRTEIDAIGRTTSNVYDGAGRLTQVTHFGGLVDNYSYDLLGHRYSHWNNQLGSYNAETTDYDAQGRVVSTRAFGGDVTSISYAWNGSLATAGLGTFGGWTQTTTYANGRTAVEASDLFDHLIQKTDLGGHVTTTTYDLAGRLTERTGGETQRFTYFNTGLAATVSTGTGTGIYFTETAHADYGYDSSGLKLTEYATSGGAVIENATATYDALGRMLTWSETGSTATPAASMAWSYDAIGNIRHETVTYGVLNASGAVSSSSTLDHWFRYDAMNRVVVANGIVVGGTIVRGYSGTELLYDAAGERMQAINTVTAAAKVRREDYSYDTAGNLAHVKVAEAGYTDNGNGTVTTSLPGTGLEKGTYSYDLMNRMTRQQDWLADGTGVAYDHQISYNASGQVSYENTSQRQGADTIISTTTNTFGSGSGYALGAVVSSTMTSSKGGTSLPTTSTTNSFAWYDGAVQSSVAYKPDTGSSTTYTTSYNYSGAGVFISAHVMDGRDRWINVVNDALGQVVKRDEADTLPGGDPHEVWYRFNGREIGHDSNNGSFESDYRTSIDTRTAASAGTGAFKNGATSETSAAQFGSGYDPITSYDQGGSGGSYTVRAGDTLASIAAQLWGDSSLWYRLADANGMGAANALAEGQTLIIPGGVSKTGNSASTFRPYDPSDAYGDTSPTTPKPQAPKKKGCGTFGMILMMVVAVAVTALVAGPASTALANIFAGPATSAAAATAAASATTAATAVGASAAAAAAAGAAASAAVLGSTAIAAGAIVGGAIAGIAGSIASQAVGNITGNVHGLSFKDIALAGISGGVSGGIGVSGLFSGSGLVQGAVRGAVGNVASQTIGTALGLQKFDWASVAVAGVVAGVGQFAGDRISGHPDYVGGVMVNPASEANQFAAGALSSLAGAATRSLLTGTDFGDNILAVLPDVIGSTVGRIVADSITGQHRVTGEERDALLQEAQGEAPPAKEPDSPSYGAGMITVVPGDSVKSLANRYGISADRIAELNGIPVDAALKPGKELFIAPDFQVGLDLDSRAAAYAKDAQALLKNWGNLSPPQRQAEFLRIVNRQLEASGVPALRSFEAMNNNRDEGFYSLAKHAIYIVQSTFDKKRISLHDFQKLANTIYHEARHAEQYFRVLEINATQGSSQIHRVAFRWHTATGISGKRSIQCTKAKAGFGHRQIFRCLGT